MRNSSGMLSRARSLWLENVAREKTRKGRHRRLRVEGRSIYLLCYTFNVWIYYTTQERGTRSTCISTGRDLTLQLGRVRFQDDRRHRVSGIHEREVSHNPLL